MRLQIVAGIVVAGLALSGCSSVTAGKPMADPDQTGISTTTSSKTTTTKRRPSTPPPNGMSTTCREYSSMDEATQLGMVELLAKNGYSGMKKNPYIWTAFIGAMCALAARDATVVDAINKKAPG